MSAYCNYCMSPITDPTQPCPVCGKTDSGEIPAHHLIPGTILNGKFLVGRSLGEGGFGITYIGRDTNLDIRVAIKEFYPNGFVSRNNTSSQYVTNSNTAERKVFFEKGKTRFLEEARVLAKFSGEPGVVDVRDFFEENNTAYIVMEYLDGITLKTHLKNNGTMAPEATVNLLMPIMNSLKKIHAQGLIHRDISPDNIMLVDGGIKLLDFGAARNVTAEGNKSLSVMLKPGYAPEEQYRSKGVQGPWTDIYALCVTMYKCITGITPDDATQRVFNDDLKAPSALGIAISPVIENALMRGMNVLQKDRWQSIDELLLAFQGVNSGNAGAATVFAGNAAQTEFRPTQPIQDTPTVISQNITSVPTANTGSQTVVPPISPVSQMPPAYPPAPPIPPVAPAQKSNGGGAKKGIIAAVIAVLVVALVAVIALPKDKADDDEKKDKNKDNTTAVEIQDSEDGQNEIIDEVPSESGEETPATTPVEKPNNGASAVTMSDNLLDFTFKLDGEVYQLPFAYSVLEGKGWTISSRGTSNETVLEANKYSSIRLSKNGKTIDVEVYNFSGNAKKIKDCKIGSIEIDNNNNIEFEIAKGISPKSSPQAIKDAFGTPSSANTYDDYESIRYDLGDSYIRASFCAYYEESRYSSISLRNFVKTDDDETITDKTLPAYLSEYKKPTALGNNILEPIIKIEGDLYRLPAPVSEFTNNGWVITANDGDVSAGATSFLTLKKGEVKLSVSIINLASYQTTPENCAVYSISIYASNYSKNPTVELPGKTKAITFDTTLAEMPSLLTGEFEVQKPILEVDDTNTENISTPTGFRYSESSYNSTRDFVVYFSFGLESHTLESFSLSCKTWNY